MKKITRRQFLEESTLLAAGGAVILPLRKATPKLPGRIQAWNEKLGRVFSGGAESFTEPDVSSNVIHRYKENEVIPLKETLSINHHGAAVSQWHRLEDGSFLQANAVQPVTNQLNAPNLDIGSSGFLGQITVPFTDAWNSRANGRKPNQIFYYGTTHWIYGLGEDEEKNLYYLIREDRWGDVYYVDATHVRIIPEEELQPISPDVPVKQKTIRILLGEQVMFAYEGDKAVFMSQIASGLLTGSVDQTTPKGNFIVNYKRPSRHMAHGERFGSNGGELFGVPWVSYFTDTGIAFHGTYWHNDFTRPKSHGCINLPIAAAKWVYLWTYPVISPRQEKHISQNGTTVEIL